MSKDANEVLSVLLDNSCPEEIEGDIRHFSIDLHCVTFHVTARRIQEAVWETVNDNPVKVSAGIWEVISYDINEAWA
jgi:hypothetical protein